VEQILEQYVATFKKYAVFEGRAGRRELWTFLLINLAVGLILGAVDGLLGLLLGAFSWVFSLVVLLPGIGVAVRRLHDTGRSGWWLLVSFIPFVGWLVLIYFYLQESQPGQNEHGPQPK